MGKEILTFDDIEIEKNRFHRHKTRHRHNFFERCRY